MIRTTTLGKLGLQVGAQGLGCNNLTGFYGRAFDEKFAQRTVDLALDLGVTLLDTADVYGVGGDIGFGGNEIFVGKAIRGRRGDVVLTSKFGWLDQPDRSASQKEVAQWGVNASSVRVDPEYMRSACDASLQRLGVDYIDLYFCHRLVPDVPVEETVGAMAELVEAGKVRFLGLSSVSSEALSRACAVHPITAVESEWSLWTRDIESEVLSVARRLGVGIIAYAPLSRGMLTGQVRSYDDLGEDDFRRYSPRFQEGNFERNLALVDHITGLAQKKGCTPSQLALAWLHAQGDDVVPIPGADRPEFVSENVGALEIELDAEELSTIDMVFPLGVTAGARYADMSSVSDARPLNT
jgi:aryl-alcohol dehydrogenase-like predicted oxidoreductase